jgi:hypothetical protein
VIDKQWTFVLGAQDPERREIERLATAAGLQCLHAAQDGVRCSASNAYAANGVVRVGRDGIARPALLPPKAPFVTIECQLAGQTPVDRVDHHQPGDPGYEKAPEDYLAGSSLGQVLMRLEMEPTETQRLLAAADHCLTAAYQGQCPGIDPHELLFLRASWRAKVSGRGLADVIDGILSAARRVSAHYDSELGESVFLDPTEVSADLPEGAAYAGKAVRYRALLPGGELKEMVKGAAVLEIERFMRAHAAAGRSVYGNPYRGYAGAYLR